MLIINFAHSITNEQLDTIVAMTNSAEPIERVIEVKTHFDPQTEFILQVNSLLEMVELTAQEWQTKKILINLPGLNGITAILLAELHGRMGYFPTILRFRPIANSIPTQFELAEVINLQAVRESARQQR